MLWSSTQAWKLRKLAWCRPAYLSADQNRASWSAGSAQRLGAVCGGAARHADGGLLAGHRRLADCGQRAAAQDDPGAPWGLCRDIHVLMWTQYRDTPYTCHAHANRCYVSDPPHTTAGIACASSRHGRPCCSICAPSSGYCIGHSLRNSYVAMLSPAAGAQCCAEESGRHDGAAPRAARLPLGTLGAHLLHHSPPTAYPPFMPPALAHEPQKIAHHICARAVRSEHRPAADTACCSCGVDGRYVVRCQL
jgi:hypothetical protein